MVPFSIAYAEAGQAKESISLIIIAEQLFLWGSLFLILMIQSLFNAKITSKKCRNLKNYKASKA